MRPSEALALHRDEAFSVFSKFHVVNPRVFGSVARGSDTEESDLDILVDATTRLSYFDLAELELELTSVFGCKVDLGIFRDLKADVAPNVIRDMRPL